MRLFSFILILALASLARAQSTRPVVREYPIGDYWPVDTLQITGSGAIRGAHANGKGVDGVTIHTGRLHAGIRVKDGQWVDVENIALWSGYPHPYPSIWEYRDASKFSCGPDVDGKPHAAVSIDDERGSKSYRVRVRNVFSYGYGVGVGIGLAGDDQMSSEITIDDCTINKCRIAVAWGKTQSFNIRLRNLDAGFVHTVVDTASYGLKRGPGPFVDGGNWSNCGRWFNLSGAGGVYVSGLYGEAVWSIGSLGNPRVKGFYPPNNFYGCRVTIGPLGGEAGLGSEYDPATAPRNLLAETAGDFSWNGGVIQSRYSQRIDNAGQVTFRDALLHWYNPVKGQRFMEFGLKSKVRFDRCRVIYGSNQYEVTGGWSKMPVAE